jgi:hypothetical protein
LATLTAIRRASSLLRSLARFVNLFGMRSFFHPPQNQRGLTVTVKCCDRIDPSRILPQLLCARCLIANGDKRKPDVETSVFKVYDEEICHGQTR